MSPNVDGMSDGQNTFQGIRSFDPSVGQWNTPDAYRGDVHDPMSQKAYMWNRNNPYAYADPSGYAYVTESLFYDDNATMFGAGSQVGGAIGLLGQLLHDVGEAIETAYDTLTQNGKSTAVPSSSALEDSITKQLTGEGYTSSSYDVPNGTVDVYKDPKRTGGSAVVGIANSGERVDLHVYGPTGLFSGYGFEFAWARYNGYGTLFYHQASGPKGFRPFGGFGPPQAAGGTD
jgi:hypothetical protein